MDNQFTMLGQPYRMADPNTLGADVRIQRERKAYFERTEGIGESEPRSSVRDRFNAWLETVEDTSLDDILTLCALLEPISGSPHLTPETVLAAQPWEVQEEMKVAISFFTNVRGTSWLEYRASKTPSETTSSETPTVETSTPESTSP